ncbi:hypothetical protein ILUMI_20016 [Ignelater luminosus]|uniref:FLYWCH-type domain-containing protein n=1 Tax=Ignelater luminosus TaxID=2038154 RepID=A0A8K0CJ04_IGNLU|nr:hypothetical protein ILUMI_20016 [Ignelater luminosus]
MSAYATEELRGFIYDKEKTREDRTYWIWKCKEYFTGPYQRRAVIKNGAIVYENHLPRGGRVGAAKVMTIVREKASTTNDNPQQIIGEATAGILKSVQATLPLVPAISKTAQRI